MRVLQTFLVSFDNPVRLAGRVIERIRQVIYAISETLRFNLGGARSLFKFFLVEKFFQRRLMRRISFRVWLFGRK